MPPKFQPNQTNQTKANLNEPTQDGDKDRNPVESIHHGRLNGIKDTVLSVYQKVKSPEFETLGNIRNVGINYYNSFKDANPVSMSADRKVIHELHKSHAKLEHDCYNKPLRSFDDEVNCFNSMTKAMEALTAYNNQAATRVIQSTQKNSD